MNLKPPARGICAATVLGCCVIVLSGCTGTTSPGQPSPTGTSPLRAAPDIVSPPHADGSQGTFEPTPEPTRPLPNCRSRGSEPHPEPSEGNAILRLLCVQADGGTDPASLARSLESNDRASRLQQVVSQFLAGPSEAEQQAGWLSPFPVAPVARASESQEGGVVVDFDGDSVPFETLDAFQEGLVLLAETVAANGFGLASDVDFAYDGVLLCDLSPDCL